MARAQSSSPGAKEESLRNRQYEGHEMEGVEDESRRRGRRSSDAELLANPALGASRSHSLSSNRPSSAQQDIEDTASREVEVLLRENKALRLQLEHEAQRARAAEQTAERFRQQAAPPCVAAKDTTGGPGDQVRRLEAEVAKLRAELEESRSHIFSLQPYRREITPKEVANDWELLFASVSDCIERLVGPTLDSETLQKELLLRARKHPSTWSAILKHLYQQPDLAQAACYPGTDLDVLIAIRGKELALTEATVSQTTKRCPGCRWPIEKNDGCSHMTCTMCSYEFCYSCGLKWNEGCRDTNCRAG
ncbi:hypothetical protein MAPG_09623 [Magnaporthiopsis poae ATCC 64411]|uniref:Uncharacterized protein n=1 Tax=Magnaporthiopsis poae (strain ATCC 64411 / 73-15) TaxID=644358 RepID=A0A0C4EAF3_MAGP6|nr:hypothetical protein MAPG_09623 [Magnaporthiopsis poae ATCC 64411]